MILDSYGRPVDPRLFERAPSSFRSDRWENNFTGIGTEADKTTHGRFFPTARVLDQELRAMRDGSDLIARAVEDRPHEMFREGYDLVGRIRKEKKSGSPTDAADDVLESDTNDLRAYAEEEMALDDTIQQTLIEGRYWGGCLSVMGLNDGGFPWEPLNEDRIQSFDYLSLVDRRYAYVQSQYSGIQAKKYGRAEMYLISNAIAGSGWNSPGSVQKKSPDELRRGGAQIQFVHETRCIRFDGNPADVQTRQRLAGWSWSVIQRLYDVTRQFEHAFDSIGYLLSDASQAVYKLQGLVKAIGAGKKQEILQRALTMEQLRSVMRGILLDAGAADGKGAESMERTPTSFQGVSDILDRFIMRFCAGAKEPGSLLFGRAPQGLNATGESEMRIWYDSVRADAQKKVAPQFQRVYRLLGLSKTSPIGGKKVDWTVTFRPLWSPTDTETADATLKNAQRDMLYVDGGIIPEEDVALGLKDQYPALDIQALEDAKKAKVSFDPHENDEPDLSQGEPLGAAPIPTLGAAPSPEGGGAGGKLVLPNPAAPEDGTVAPAPALAKTKAKKPTPGK